MAFELTESRDVGPVLVYQHTLSRYQDVAVFDSLNTAMGNGHFPLPSVCEPMGAYNACVQMKVTV
jgi:hypothetical protein